MDLQPAAELSVKRAAPRSKQALKDELVAKVAADLDTLERAQKAAAEGATHEEAKPENDKDTRALEATYLARGLAERVVALEHAAAALASLKLRSFGSDAPVALSAIVTLAPEQGPAAHYFVVPAAGGLKLTVGAQLVTTITLDAPLGRALLGAYQGDEITVQSPQGSRVLEIERVL